MKRTVCHALGVWAGLLFAYLLASASQADTLFLQNGDRLSGVLVGVAECSVTFETDYAGELHIDVGCIQAVTTDVPIAVRLHDGTVYVGQLAVQNDTQVLLVEGTSQTLNVDEIEGVAADLESLIGLDEPETEWQKWSGAVDAGISLRSGETDTFDATTGLTLVREGVDNTLTLTLTGGYNEVDSQVNTRLLKGDAKWEHHPWERFYLFGRTAGEHDPGHRLELRLEGSGGVGYDLIKQERRSLSFDAGIGYAHEWWNLHSIKEIEDAKRVLRTSTRASLLAFLKGKLSTRLVNWTRDDWLKAFELTLEAAAADVDQETTTEDHVYLHLAGNFQQKLFKNCTLCEDLLVLPKLDDTGEYRLKSDLSFDTPLSDKLSLRVNLLTEYDSDTGTGDDLLTNTFTTALRYSF